MSGLLRRHHEAGGPAPPSAATPPPLKRAVLDATDRVQQIIDVAEEAAREVRAEAEHEADRIRESARAESDAQVRTRMEELSERLAPLARRLEGVKAEVSLLAVEVDSLLERVRGDEPATSATRATGGDAQTAVVHPYPRPAEPPAEPPEARDGGDQSTEGHQALLRATQMVVAGSERAEIEQALRDELGVHDPEAIVDQALGTR